MALSQFSLTKPSHSSLCLLLCFPAFSRPYIYNNKVCLSLALTQVNFACKFMLN